MKLIFWLLPGMLLSTSVVAQQPVTNLRMVRSTNAVAQQSVTNTPTARSARPAIVEPDVSLVPGPAAVAAKNLNVRAQPTIYSETITQLNPGDNVTVLEQTNLDKLKPEEPRQWARIVYPDKADVWAHTSFIDRNTMTVTANELNLRAGPGENYSIVGTVTKGTPVREVLTDGHWMRIGAPTNAYAFVAAMYLHQEAPTITEPVVAATATNEMPEVEPTPTTVAEEQAVATAVEPETITEPTNTSPTEPMTVPEPALLPAELTPPQEPPPPRVATHEGIVKRTVSIQAPTPFQLVNPDTGRIVNYLLSPTTNLDLSLYHGLRIVVTGEEGLDQRWTNTPVLTIKRIHVVE